MPLGLIMHELISNSIQHAFVHKKVGNITISMNEKGLDYEINVKDNGTGIPKEVSLENPKTLGLTLVNMLITQLEGTIKVTRERGTLFTILIPQNGEKEYYG